MYIFQPDRFLLQKQVRQYAHHITGKTLDVGAGGYARYDKLFPDAVITKMDVYQNDNVDVVGSADNIPFDDASFDSIICTQVFEHLSEPFIAAAELSRVLKVGGHVLLTVPQVNELHEEPHDYFRYTKFGLKHMFEKNNLELIDCQQRGGYYTTMAQLRTRFLIDKYGLYQRKILGRLCSKMLSMYSHFAMWRDRCDASEANRKHTIGWAIILQKK